MKVRKIIRVASWALVVSLGLLIAGGTHILAKGSFARPQGPFVAVFVDDKTERTLGPFPYDRSRYAAVLKVIERAGAKAVIIKYFLDQSKPGNGDGVLAAQLGTLPCFLQARLDEKESRPNPLPARFDRSREVGGDPKFLLGGDSGWVPIEGFASKCAGIGFADRPSEKDVLRVPMVLRYKEALVPSLELVALEAVFGVRGKIRLGEGLELDGHTLRLDQKGEVRVQLPADGRIDHISFLDVLNGDFPRDRLKSKVVVLGFDSERTPSLMTPNGPVRIHRLFFHSLENLYEQLMLVRPGSMRTQGQ